MILNNFNITIANASPLHSTSNGQVERFHSTLVEISRCLKVDKLIDDTIELILLATTAYNRTVHSITNKKPVDIIHSTPIELESEIRERIRETQDKTREQANKTKAHREYQVSDKVWFFNQTVRYEANTIMLGRNDRSRLRYDGSY